MDILKYFEVLTVFWKSSPIEMSENNEIVIGLKIIFVFKLLSK